MAKHAQMPPARKRGGVIAAGVACLALGGLVTFSIQAAGQGSSGSGQTCSFTVGVDGSVDGATIHCAAPTVEPTTTTPTTTPPSDSPTPTPTPSDTDPSTGDFPDAANTGVPAGTALRRVPQDVASGSGWHWDSRGWVVIDGKGAVFSGYSVNSEVDIQADNVTVSDNRIINTGNAFGVAIRHADNATIRNNTVSGATAGGADSNRLTAGIKDVYGDSTGSQILDNNVFDVSGGIVIDTGLVQDNYVHDMGYDPADHVDCFQSFDIGDLMIRHNTFLNANNQTAAILFQWSSTQPSGHTVTDNLLAGGGYTIYGGDQATDVQITNNVFSTRYYAKSGYYGPLAHYQSNTGNAFTGNVWADGPNAGKSVN